MRTQEQLDRAIQQAFLAIEGIIQENVRLTERLGELESANTKGTKVLKSFERYAVSNNEAIHELMTAVTDSRIVLDEHTYSIERIERTRMEVVK